MFLMVFAALLVLSGILYMARTAIWWGIAQPPAFFRAGSRHSRALKARHAIPRAWRKLAGPCADGNRCSSVVVGCQFLTFGALMRWERGTEAPAVMLPVPQN